MLHTETKQILYWVTTSLTRQDNNNLKFHVSCTCPEVIQISDVIFGSLPLHYTWDVRHAIQDSKGTQINTSVTSIWCECVSLNLVTISDHFIVNLRVLAILMGDDDTKWFVNKNDVESMIFDVNTTPVHDDKSLEVVLFSRIFSYSLCHWPNTTLH